jgi:1,4-alpha-glucan branching enzyme
MPFGAEFQPGGSVRFSLWAPNQERITVELSDAETRLPMQREADGWHRLTTDRAASGSRYRFILPDGFAVPDPASRYQPADVHGPSEVVDPQDYAWQDGDWHGRPWRPALSWARSSDWTIWSSWV